MKALGVRGLRIGTRASELARRQAAGVADRLAAALGTPTELVPITTAGDRDRRALVEIGGQGVFVTAVRESLRAGRVDVAVHSLKDLPTVDDPHVVLAAVPLRSDPRDCVVARGGALLLDLPPGARVGTGSLRRAAQLHAMDLGLDVVPIRGNVDTRLSRVASGDLDAVVLARAGLLRLGRESEETEVLDPLRMLPAPGQGALAVEVAAAVRQLAADVAAALDDADSRAAVTAERAVLRTLGAGCTAPVGALAEVVLGDDSTELWVRSVVLSPDGRAAVRLSATGSPDSAELLGAELAQRLLDEGAADLVAEPVR